MARGNNWVNNRPGLARTGRYSKPRRSVKQAVFNSYDKLKDHQKNNDFEINFDNSIETLAPGGNGIPAAGQGVLKLVTASGNSALRILVCEPVTFDSTGAKAAEVNMAGQRYLYKAFGAELALSVTHDSENVAPIQVMVDLIKVKGALDTSVGAANANSLYTYDKDHLGDSKVYKVMSKLFTIAPNSVPRKIKFWKGNMNTIMKREVTNETHGSEDRATDRYMLCFKFLENTGGLLPVLRIVGRISSRCYEM